MVLTKEKVLGSGEAEGSQASPVSWASIPAPFSLLCSTLQFANAFCGAVSLQQPK